MATTAPFVKLLRQLSRGKDEYRSGALDIAWEEGTASIFLVFGQPNHATFEDLDGLPLEGPEALSALITRLPRQFTISPWRKVVVRTETLKCTLDELMEPFAQLAGAASPAEGSGDQSAAVASGNEVGTGFQADIDFGLEDFPLLPLGQSLWSDAAASVVHLDILVPKLPDALIVLTGPKLRAAAVVVGGQIIDAVWVDDQEQAVGEGAAMALMGAREGSVSGYRLDDPRLAEALTMLWRCPIAFRRLPASWLAADRFLDGLTSERRDCALLLSGGARGVALYLGGDLLAVYTDAERLPSASRSMLRQLMETSGAVVTVRQRAAARTSERLPEESFHSYVDGPMRAEHGPEAQAATAPAEPGRQAAAIGDAPASSGNPEAGTTTSSVAPPDQADPSATESTPGPPPTDLGGWQQQAPAANGEAPDPGWIWPQPPAVEGHVSDTTAADPPLGDIAATPAAATTPVEGGLAAWGETFQPGPTPPEGYPEDARADDPAAAAEAVWPAGQIQPQWSFPAADAGPAAAAAPDHPATAPDGSHSGLTDTPFEPSRLGLDYDSVKADLIQIGVLWLGGDDVAPVARLITETKPSVDHFISTIDAIKVITLPGHDPSVIRAMAREMHYHAAECLCGA